MRRPLLCWRAVRVRLLRQPRLLCHARVSAGGTFPYSCASGECEPLIPTAGICQDDDDCRSDHCVEGTCCAQAACEPPKRCDVRFFEGVCTDPDSFGPQSFGKPCAGESDCDPIFFCT